MYFVRRGIMFANIVCVCVVFGRRSIVERSDGLSSFPRTLANRIDLDSHAASGDQCYLVASL